MSELCIETSQKPSRHRTETALRPIRYRENIDNYVILSISFVKLSLLSLLTDCLIVISSDHVGKIRLPNEFVWNDKTGRLEYSTCVVSFLKKPKVVSLSSCLLTVLSAIKVILSVMSSILNGLDKVSAILTILSWSFVNGNI